MTTAMLLATVGCSTNGAADPRLAPCAAPAISTDGWEAIQAGGFSFRLPRGFERTDVQGVDSQVGMFRSGAGHMQLSYDLGWYSNDLSPDSTTFSEYRACSATIDGRPARVITATMRNDADGIGRYVAAAAWRELYSDGPPVHLTIWNTARERMSLDTLHAVLRTVRFDR